MSWCTIESDPGVFTELISEIGVKGVEVAELYELSAEEFQRMPSVYGLVFLFQCVKDDTPVKTEDMGTEVFFAKQVINNACATQAIINVLMNRPEIELGEEVSSFKSFAKELPPDMRGLAIGNSSKFRNAHNSFAIPEPFHFEEKKEKDEDGEAPFHFIGYVPVNGKVYELDGLQEGPVLVGDCNMDTWYDVARPAIQARIAKYSEKSIKFNLLALVKSKREELQQQLAELEKNNASAAEKVQVEAALAAENEKYQKWKEENVRRKHNYVPFIFNLLKVLASKGKLKGLVDQAKDAAKAKEEAEKAKKDTKK
eukprot:CAMPEP_0175152516 /NCGR_PEP_ID=MMETSP0087-20121206/19158_1 /TAXON_ID=136419 /ORGANISM="Unknown Unknown, Strain D1" /LENGTH=311 /DNA_ID=CAMNT_0016438959 /DNA_START=11 /DNA_END=946 /DNA_ORIENTATION=+